MNPALAAQLDVLSSVGWKVVSQTDTTASLETRGPFSWWVFLFCLIFVPLVGSTIYILWWLIFDNHHLFARVENDSVVTSGDTWLVDRQMVNLERTRQVQREIKEKGFWSVALPPILGVLATIVLWFFFIWLFVQIIE
jgi:hypothetical protein